MCSCLLLMLTYKKAAEFTSDGLFSELFSFFFFLRLPATSEAVSFLTDSRSRWISMILNFVLPKDGPPLYLLGAPIVGPCNRVLHLLPWINRFGGNCNTFIVPGYFTDDLNWFFWYLRTKRMSQFYCFFRAIFWRPSKLQFPLFSTCYLDSAELC